MADVDVGGQATRDTSEYDVVIIGAGFAGLYSLHKLRGEGNHCRVFERGTGVGGVWYRNRYPGARVDVESLEYSYTFSADLEREWKWGERYSSQPELEAYANQTMSLTASTCAATSSCRPRCSPAISTRRPAAGW